VLIKDLVPSVHFYDQDFVDMYDRTWVWVDEYWAQGTKENGISGGYLGYPGQKTLNQFHSCLSALFLVYSNQNYSPFPMVDYLYGKQEPSGAIRSDYSLEDGRVVVDPSNPEGVAPPIFAYVEHSFYHKVGNKKRLKEIVPILEKHFDWMKDNFLRENGLYSVPAAATMLGNCPRDRMYYPVDFNSQLAVNALYLSAIGDILNDKELSFRYKRLYFSLKTRINSLMWDPDDNFYYDLDVKGNRLKRKHIGAYWTLLAEIPNEERADKMIDLLSDPHSFGTENPFPTIPVDDPDFSEQGNGYRGGVVPFCSFVVIKGLERYGKFEFARECAIRHLYFILDTLHPDGEETGDVWEAYLPLKEGPSVCSSIPDFPRRRFLPMVGLVTITLMIEDIIGLVISLPRKTVDWTMTNLEAMGIEGLSLKRNLITILSNKQPRGWEIRLESEKLYYFTIEILAEHKKKTLPIPSGKCSMLIDKL
jgi:neutral trehalase